MVPLPTSLADVFFPHQPYGLPLTALLAHLEVLPPTEDLDDSLVGVGLVGTKWQLHDRYPLVAVMNATDSVVLAWALIFFSGRKDLEVRNLLYCDIKHLSYGS